MDKKYNEIQIYAFVFIIALVVFLTILSYYLFFPKITEKIYNKIICYYITRRITNGLDNFNDKVSSIRNFIHKNIHPINGYYNRLDTCAIQKLTYGIGWCDQQARVFMQLASSVGITSRPLFLRSENGSSPHSIAEALAPDGRWIIVDPLYNLNLINKDDNPASQSDVRKNLSILTNNKKIELAAKYKDEWADPVNLSIYSNPPTYVITKKGSKINVLRFVPLQLIRPVVSIVNNRYLNQIEPNIKDVYKFKFIKARTYHLLGYYEDTSKLYNEVIGNSKDLLLICKAEYYNALLLKDQKKYKNAYIYINDVINKNRNNPYFPYLRGLRAKVLEKMGKSNEAEKDLLDIEYALEEY